MRDGSVQVCDSNTTQMCRSGTRLEWCARAAWSRRWPREYRRGSSHARCHHAQGVNIEQIVALLAEAGRLGGFHFNNRKYADDDLIVGSVNPFELFLIFSELVHGPEDALPRLTIDQSHNIETKVEAMVISVLNLQEAYAKALLIDRAALADAQQRGDVLAGHALIREAFCTDVRPLCAKVRAAMGAAADPLAELRSSGYLDTIAAARA